MYIKKSIKIIAGLCFLILLGTKLYAQTSENNKSLLWKISTKNSTHISYLFGTIHLICPDEFVWTPSMHSALNISEKVCFEMKLDDPSIMMETALAMVNKEGKSLKDYFTVEQYATLEKYFKEKSGMDLKMFERLKPIALQSLITADLSECPTPVSYEDSIMKMAKSADKTILGLETPKEQIDVLDSQPTDSVIKDILNEIEKKSDADDEYKKLVSIYKSQDLPELYTLLTGINGLGNEMGNFLDNRNTKWISRMEDKMKNNSVFFAVGAGHLWGDKGVINLLRKKGYTVEAIH